MNQGAIFPPAESANADGIVAIGGDLNPATLIEAYQQGIFPWPISPQWPLAWFSPDPRGIIYTHNFHIPRKLQQFLKKSPFSYRFNSCFKEVIKECANCNNRPGQTDTWITPALAKAYTNLYEMGLAYSVETYCNEKLVGGLYGICMGKVISAESMYFKKTNASKAALICLLQHLQQQKIEWIDIQMITPVTKLLGGTEIKRSQFLNMLKEVMKAPQHSSIFPMNSN